MGLYEKLFPKKSVDYVTQNAFRTLVGYEPCFRSYSGGIYEAELCRSSIHAIANHCSKLKPVISGARQDLQTILEYQPNPWMDTTKFLYKLASTVETEGTAFVVPMYDKYYQKIVGFYPVRPSQAEVRERAGVEYLVFTFADGRKASLEFNRVGILTKYFYKKEFFGETNEPLNSVLDLMYTQKQGIQEGIKQSATIRFLGRLTQTFKDKDIEAERKRWAATNLASDNNGGIALFDGKYADVRQIDSKPYIVNSAEMEIVQDSVFSYFGVNKKILQNTFSPDEWAAFYEAKIEPFALQLSLVLTNVLFTAEQKVRGNSLMFTSNRLQYASTNEKLSVVQQLTDRGMMSRNEGREVFNLSPVEGGDNFIARGEYYDVSTEFKKGDNSTDEQ